MRILLIDDDERDIHLFERAIDHAVRAQPDSGEIEVQAVSSLTEAQALVLDPATPAFDVIFADLYLTGVGLGQEAGAVEQLARLSQIADCPLIVMTAADTEPLLWLMNHGPARLLRKDGGAAFGAILRRVAVEVSLYHRHTGARSGLTPLQAQLREVRAEVRSGMGGLAEGLDRLSARLEAMDKAQAAREARAGLSGSLRALTVWVQGLPMRVWIRAGVGLASVVVVILRALGYLDVELPDVDLPDVEDLGEETPAIPEGAP